jgi:hypothetical protein
VASARVFVGLDGKRINECSVTETKKMMVENAGGQEAEFDADDGARKKTEPLH